MSTRTLADRLAGRYLIAMHEYERHPQYGPRCALARQTMQSILETAIRRGVKTEVMRKISAEIANR